MSRFVTVGENSSGGKAFYKCVITKTNGSDAGKTFKYEDEDCVCIYGGSGDEIDESMQKKIESLRENAFCECGEGWSCVVTKIDDAPAFSCTGSCTCITSTT